METQSPKPTKFILNYGILLGIISIVLGVILYVTNAYLDPGWYYSVLGFVILIAVIFMGIKAFKTENGGYLSLSQALKVGIGIALIGGVITAIWTLVLTNVIQPDYMEQVAEVQRDKMIENGMSAEQVDAAMEMSAKFQTSWMIVAFTLIGNLFFGLIISLFSGLILKNKDPREA